MTTMETIVAPAATAGTGTVNGIDTAALGRMAAGIAADPSKAEVAFRASTAWRGGTLSRTHIEECMIGGETVQRDFAIDIDEPLALLGGNTAPNPQEVLLAALNACLTVGYVAGAAVRGITLRSVEIETTGAIDLRGFLGLAEGVAPGCETIRYRVKIAGDGTAEQFREIHDAVVQTSPNYYNLSRPVRLEAELVVGG